VPTLTERLDWAIRRAMSADPEKRPASCREFIEDLTGKSTRRLPTVDSNIPQQELWYLVYKDETGLAHTVKGTVSAVRRSLKDGLLGDASNVRAARSKAGPFEPLRGYPEFRDMVVEAAPLSLPQATTSRATDPSPDAETVQNHAPLRQEGAPAAPRVSLTPAAVRKPHINLVAPSSSAGMEALKWLFFFALFILTAAVAFLFF
jgi:hypothetical protein